MLDIGFQETVLILLVALMLFGGNLPDVARKLGRSVGELKRGFSESTRPLRDAQAQVEREVAEVAESADPNGRKREGDGDEGNGNRRLPS